MKKTALAALAVLTVVSASAQSSIDAYRLSQTDLRGTARYMSMAGAFGALGGDLSTLANNPAGIGIYRSSEIGLTLDLDLQKSNVDGSTDTKTTFTVPNFGYVGAIKLQSDVMPYFQWGATYARQQSFDRVYSGGFGSLNTSMSNYIANFTNGYAPNTLGQTSNYNPYSSSDANWLSILAYNSYIVNPTSAQTDRPSDYKGLYGSGTTGNSLFSTRQKGYVDEYNVNFGGNFVDMVYWGIGLGITDLSFSEETYYDEELTNARIASGTGMSNAAERGNAYYSLGNYRTISGSGFNFKIGAILKPINELRLGIAFHTPTYYNLTDRYSADIQYSYSSDIQPGTAYTDYARYDWKLRTPWRMMVSAAGVIGGRFIVSAEYEYQPFNAMRTLDFDGRENKDYTSDIKQYYKAANTLRLGAECRITPQLSARAGFAYTTTGLKSGVNNGDEYVFTGGCNPAYTFDTSTRYITLGLGYRSGAFSVDLAYVNRLRESTYHPFTSFDPVNDTLSAADAAGNWVYAPAADFSTTDNNIVLSLGYKF